MSIRASITLVVITEIETIFAGLTSTAAGAFLAVRNQIGTAKACPGSFIKERSFTFALYTLTVSTNAVTSLAFRAGLNRAVTAMSTMNFTALFASTTKKNILIIATSATELCTFITVGIKSVTSHLKIVIFIFCIHFAFLIFTGIVKIRTPTTSILAAHAILFICGIRNNLTGKSIMIGKEILWLFGGTPVSYVATSTTFTKGMIARNTNTIKNNSGRRSLAF